MDTHLHAGHGNQLRSIAAVLACLTVVSLLFTSGVTGFVHARGAAVVPAPQSERTPVAATSAACPSWAGATASAERPSHQGVPAFTSLTPFEDDVAGYGFWYPNGWQPVELAGQRNGIQLLPECDDPATFFSVDVAESGTQFVSEDVPSLVATFREALATLPNYTLEWEDQWVIGSLIGLEAKLTFDDGAATRMRWIRLLYEHDMRYYVVAQGASAADYTYWEPMLFEMMTTVVINYEPPDEQKPQAPGSLL